MVDDHDDAECTIRGEFPPVGGEIYAAIPSEQRLIWLTALTLFVAVVWLITRR